MVLWVPVLIAIDYVIIVVVILILFLNYCRTAFFCGSLFFADFLKICEN